MKTKFFLFATLFSGSLNAAPLQGMYFSHQDWEVACDNTGTCRVAGYQRGEDSFRRSISVLFTRQAGENAPISGKMVVLEPEDENGNGVSNFTFSPQSQLLLNNQSLGSLKRDKDGVILLSDEQTQTLLKSLKQHSKIQFKSSGYTWELSDKGAAAVLLKADEFQQRLNTPNAWIKTGNSQHLVLQPQTKPNIQAAKVAQTGEYTLKPSDKRYTPLLNRLRAINKKQGADNECFSLQNDENLSDFQIYPLNPNKVLVEAVCINGAYQTSLFYAIFNPQLSQMIEALPLWAYGGQAGYDAKTGELGGSFKGRGLGDCWGITQAVFNGNTFVKTQETAMPMCRGFTGNAWEMPIFISNVLPTK